MKLNINTLLSGGRLYFSAVADPSSLAAKRQQPDSNGSQSSNSSGLLSKETMNKLYEGLPNEANRVFLMMSAIELQIDSGAPIDKRVIADFRSAVNRTIQQAKYLEKAQSFASQNGALDDVAIDQNGYIYAYSADGKMHKVAFDLWDPEKYLSVNYGELLEYRRNSPEAVDNADIVKSIGNGIGVEKINEFILSILDKVGSTETKEEAMRTLLSLIGKDAKQLSQLNYAALKALAGASDQIGLDQIFKISTSVKDSNIQQAANYIISILPKNMRSLLQGTYIALGGSPTHDYAAELILMAALSSRKLSTAQEIDYDPSLNKDTKGGTEKTLTRNIEPIEELVNGSASPVDIIFRDSKRPDLNITIHGSGKGALPDLKGNPIPKTIAALIYDTYASLVDEKNLFVGNLKITPADLESVVYNGSSVANVWVPVDLNGSIDLSAYIEFLQIQSELDKHPEMSAQEKTALLNNEFGIPGYIDSNNVYHGDGQRMLKFLVFNGTTTNAIVDYDNGILMEKLIGDDRDAELESIEKLYSAINGASGSEAGFEFKKKLLGTILLNAPVFMKLKLTAQRDASSFTGHGALVNTPTYASSIARDNMRYLAQLKPQVTQPLTGYAFAE